MSKQSEAQLLYNEFYEWRLEDSPEFATMYGVHKYDDKLESYTLASFQARLQKVQCMLSRASELKKNLSDENLDLFIEMLQLYIDGFNTTSYVFPLCRIEGVHVDLPQTISQMKFDTKEDFRKLVDRLTAVPEQVDGIIEIMEEGIKRGLTFHSVSMKNIVENITEIISTEVTKSAFYAPVVTAQIALDDDLKLCVVEAIRHCTFSGFEKLRNFLRDEYLPKCRTEIGISSVAGENYYSQCLKYHLGYSISAKEVHQIGLDEVERINEAIQNVVTELGFGMSPKEFANKMREDTQFVLNSDQEIKKNYEKILDTRIRPRLTKYFKALPSAKLNLVLMDKSRAAGPAAFYIQGSSDGARPGTFYINGNTLDRNPSHFMPALALHEAEPGHHFQWSRGNEMKDIPLFRNLVEDRRYSDMPTHFPMHTSHVEGWGLYSEFLGHEMGIYETPYERYGHYSQEMLRACRLVVDTGMHALGWARQDAIDFLVEYTASSIHEIECEIDRYITWPGQACGYKIGELKIKMLRERATSELGEKFNLADFHDVVITHVGTMDYLERAVDQYIAKNK